MESSRELEASCKRMYFQLLCTTNDELRSACFIPCVERSCEINHAWLEGKKVRYIIHILLIHEPFMCIRSVLSKKDTICNWKRCRCIIIISRNKTLSSKIVRSNRVTKLSGYKLYIYKMSSLSQNKFFLRLCILGNNCRLGRRTQKRLGHDTRVVVWNFPLSVFPDINKWVPTLDFVPGRTHGKFIDSNILAPVF